MNIFKSSLAFIMFAALNASAAPEGAFTTLMVQANDVEKYIDYMKKNTAPFEAIDSDVAGVCVTKSGNQYPGEMFVWNAFPSIEKAFAVSELYDPMNTTSAFEKLRSVKYSATFKPIKEFDLKPGYERLWRLKLNDWRAFAADMTILEKALQKAGHEMRLGVFYPLGGGNEVFHLRAVTIDGAASGRVADDYFAGAEYGQIWDNAFAKYVDEIVSETVESCEIIYTK
ncbi:MAG: hypothetical protein P8P39_07510 [SAR86 cluster bacterium]|nr:hypothetical protein [SAR86 cluster bacterium]